MRVPYEGGSSGGTHLVISICHGPQSVVFFRHGLRSRFCGNAVVAVTVAVVVVVVVAVAGIITVVIVHVYDNLPRHTSARNILRGFAFGRARTRTGCLRVQSIQDTPRRTTETSRPTDAITHHVRCMTARGGSVVASVLARREGNGFVGIESLVYL